MSEAQALGVRPHLEQERCLANRSKVRSWIDRAIEMRSERTHASEVALGNLAAPADEAGQQIREVVPTLHGCVA